MNVRWTAVLTGFLVDFFIALVLSPFVNPDIYTSPDLSSPTVLLWLGLPVVLTTISGYVAGRMAKTSRVLNGFLVQVVSILFSQLDGPIPRVAVVTYLLACGFAALGGYLSHFPRERWPRSTERS